MVTLMNLRVSMLLAVSGISIVFFTVSAFAEDALLTSAAVNKRLELSAEQLRKTDNILVARDASCRKYIGIEKHNTCLLFAERQAEFQLRNILTAEQKVKFDLMQQEKLTVQKLERDSTARKSSN